MILQAKPTTTVDIFNSSTEAHIQNESHLRKRSGHWKCHIKIQRFVHSRQLFDPSEREGYEKLSAFLCRPEVDVCNW